MVLACPSCGARNLEGVDECANCGGDLRAVGAAKGGTVAEASILDRPLTALEQTKVYAIEAGAPLEDAIHALNRQKLDILEVVEGGQLVGLLSVRDIMNRVGVHYQGKLRLPVRQFMTSKPETLPPDAPISYALNKMDVGGYRHVPVVDGEKMVGMVSVRDVIRYVVKQGKGG